MHGVKGRDMNLLKKQVHDRRVADPLTSCPHLVRWPHAWCEGTRHALIKKTGARQVCCRPADMLLTLARKLTLKDVLSDCACKTKIMSANVAKCKKIWLHTPFFVVSKALASWRLGGFMPKFILLDYLQGQEYSAPSCCAGRMHGMRGQETCTY